MQGLPPYQRPSPRHQQGPGVVKFGLGLSISGRYADGRDVLRAVAHVLVVCWRDELLPHGLGAPGGVRGRWISHGCRVRDSLDITRFKQILDQFYYFIFMASLSLFLRDKPDNSSGKMPLVSQTWLSLPQISTILIKSYCIFTTFYLDAESTTVDNHVLALYYFIINVESESLYDKHAGTRVLAHGHRRCERSGSRPCRRERW